MYSVNKLVLAVTRLKFVVCCTSMKIRTVVNAAVIIIVVFFALSHYLLQSCIFYYQDTETRMYSFKERLAFLQDVRRCWAQGTTVSLHSACKY